MRIAFRPLPDGDLAALYTLPCCSLTLLVSALTLIAAAALRPGTPQTCLYPSAAPQPLHRFVRSPAARATTIPLCM